MLCINFARRNMDAHRGSVEYQRVGQSCRSLWDDVAGAASQFYVKISPRGPLGAEGGVVLNGVKVGGTIRQVTSERSTVHSGQKDAGFRRSSPGSKLHMCLGTGNVCEWVIALLKSS